MLPEPDVVLRPAAELGREHLLRLSVEDAEPVVVPGDSDVAPERDVRVGTPRRRVEEAVVEPHVRAVRRGRGLHADDGRNEREQDDEPAKDHAAGMLIRSLTRD